MIFHTNANFTQSIQEYCGANWHVFLFNKSELTDQETLTSTEGIQFEVNQQSLIERASAILNASSANTSGTLIFTQTGGSIGLRKEGVDFYNPNLFAAIPRSAQSVGSRAALTVQDQINILDKVTAVSMPTNAVSSGIQFNFAASGYGAKHVRYIDIFMSVAVPFTVTSVSEAGPKTHELNRIGNTRYEIDNEDDLESITINIVGGSPATNITRVDFLSDREVETEEIVLDYAIVCPVTFNASVLPVDALRPFFLVNCGGPNTSAEIMLADTYSLLPNEPLRILNFTVRTQILETT